jgi:hypothetical protein
MPVYPMLPFIMSMFLLPKNTIKNLDKQRRIFFGKDPILIRNII